MKDAELSAVLARRDERELLATRARLIDDKKKIERQISDDKFDMQAERAELLDGGASPREAQIRATSSGDQDWRQRAVHAGIVIDAQLARVKAVLADVRVAKQEANAAAPTDSGRLRHEQWELFIALVHRLTPREYTDALVEGLARRAVKMQQIFDRVRGEQ